MKQLVAKEIRMLLPAFVAALLLAVAPLWLFPKLYSGDDLSKLIIPLFCFGVLLMSLTTFGREFGMGTFPLLLALPLTRGRIWWAKIAVLAFAMAIVFAAGIFSAIGWFKLGSAHLSWIYDGIDIRAAVVIAFVVAIASGLWTTLLLRQMVAAFWFALLIPLTILTLVLWNGGKVWVVETALGLYSAAGFCWAWRQFYRAQEVAWTGGEINLPGLRSSRAFADSAGRNYRPLAALLWKELQLYQIALAGMAGLFVLHLCVLLLRKALAGNHDNSILNTALTEFGGLWFLVPVITGSLNVADERRLGTMEGHLCLPVSLWVQFVVKLLVVLILSGLLSALLLWAAEDVVGRRFHVTGGVIASLNGAGLGTVTLVFLILSLCVFYASTLARSILQAIVVAVGLLFALSSIFGVAEHIQWSTGVWLWGAPLFDVIAWPIMVVAALWLAYSNFRRFTETRHLWFRNLRWFAVCVLFAATLATLLFHRVWEYLTPLEPPHGAPHLNVAQSPRLGFDWATISVSFPDGPLWWKQSAYDFPRTISPFGENYPVPLGRGKWLGLEGNHFLDGDDWVALARNYNEHAGVRSDGTLWVSEKPVRAFVRRNGLLIPQQPAPMVRFGQAADWKDIVREGENDMLLLKADGTLWQWGTNESKTWPGLVPQQPIRLGTASNWSRIFGSPLGVFAWKNDGRAWLAFPGNAHVAAGIILEANLGFAREEIFDNLKLRSLAACQWFWLAVREDGTLWTFGGPRPVDVFNNAHRQVIRIGTATDWVSVAGDNRMMIGLRADGTLWKWNAPDFRPKGMIQPFSDPPARLGTHGDWVALGGSGTGICSLAADGSIWCWSLQDNYVWLAPPRKPFKLDNIFSQ